MDIQDFARSYVSGMEKDAALGALVGKGMRFIGGLAGKATGAVSRAPRRLASAWRSGVSSARKGYIRSMPKAQQSTYVASRKAARRLVRSKKHVANIASKTLQRQRGRIARKVMEGSPAKPMQWSRNKALGLAAGSGALGLAGGSYLGGSTQPNQQARY